MTAKGSGSPAMCLKCHNSTATLAVLLSFINFSIKGIGLPLSSSSDFFRIHIVFFSQVQECMLSSPK